MKPVTASPKAARLRLRLTLTVIIEPDGVGLLHAYAPGLQGLHVHGHTEQEALQNAADAAHCYVASLIEHGDPLPIGPHFNAERVEETTTIPPGALLRNIEVQWPLAEACGSR